MPSRSRRTPYCSAIHSRMAISRSVHLGCPLSQRGRRVFCVALGYSLLTMILAPFGSAPHSRLPRPCVRSDALLPQAKMLNESRELYRQAGITLGVDVARCHDLLHKQYLPHYSTLRRSGKHGGNRSGRNSGERQRERYNAPSPPSLSGSPGYSPSRIAMACLAGIPAAPPLVNACCLSVAHQSSPASQQG